ncbi:unnamed protein product [Danaus chrysippus]|uniref:(African queen) hypothetical protein n=1 Tax=Danaus chrysippus TaxID=151541 RepID=A0A8J2QJP7_9NEOP|nr:unnamed protein product [Danaus chrysippus]
MVNFRSSIFGFLNTEDDFAEGNMGAKDILLALKWLLDNIRIFNGDPGRITIMGSGEATTSVASMLLTRAAGTLFQRAIIMDGSALSPADYRPYNFEVANKLFWKFNGSWDQFNRRELYNILKNTSAVKLKLASRDLYDSTEVRDKQRLINAFSCTVENNSGDRAFMTKSPVDVYKGKKVSKIDVIFGYTTFPSLFKLGGISKNRKLLRYLNYNFQYLLPFEGQCDEYLSKRYRKIRKKIMNFYFINGTITDFSFKRYAKYISDQTIYPLLRQVVLQSKVSKGSIYLYRLPFNGPLNMRWRKFVPNLKWKGATSGDEICYLFKCKSELETYNRIGKVNETRFISRIVRLFGNFVKFGVPTRQGVDNIVGSLKWLPLEERRPLRAMNMGHHFKMVNVPEEKRMLFWNHLRKKYFSNK